MAGSILRTVETRTFVRVACSRDGNFRHLGKSRMQAALTDLSIRYVSSSLHHLLPLWSIYEIDEFLQGF